MKQVDLYCQIHWTYGEESLKERVFLFCINGKCMSGKIVTTMKLPESENFEIAISFIDSEYFNNEKKLEIELRFKRLQKY